MAIYKRKNVIEKSVDDKFENKIIRFSIMLKSSIIHTTGLKLIYALLY